MPIEDLSGLERWLASECRRVLDAIIAGPKYDDASLEALIHVGALAPVLPTSISVFGKLLGTPLNRLVDRLHLEPAPAVGAELGTQAHNEEINHRYPTICEIQNLTQGYAAADHGHDGDLPRRLDQMKLSAAGELLGREIIETLSRGIEASSADAAAAERC